MKGSVFPAIGFLLLVFHANGQSTVSKLDSATVMFNNPAVGFQAALRGLLQWPSLPGKRPVVVMIHGSGKGSRYEYRDLFSLFLNQGYAVFSYDKRGVAGSGGAYNGVGPKNSPMMIPLLASDGYEAIQAIRKRPEIDSTRIILFGVSQAGWIIPIIAAMDKSISHFVILSGPTISVGEEIYYSRIAEAGNLSIEMAENKMRQYKGLRGFDPLPYVARVKQQGLWVYGAKDTSIPTSRSAQLLDSLGKVMRKSLTVKVYPDVGHDLVNRETGQRDFIGFMFDWLDKNLK
jgi:dipeptidyl aminopeptidase/acylaminoacyl peptidase